MSSYKAISYYMEYQMSHTANNLYCLVTIDPQGYRMAKGGLLWSSYMVPQISYYHNLYTYMVVKLIGFYNGLF